MGLCVRGGGGPGIKDSLLNPAQLQEALRARAGAGRT